MEDYSKYVITLENLDKLPKRIYQYRRFNEFTAQNFENSQIYFNHPKNFNDPFEFLPNFTIDKADIDNFFKEQRLIPSKNINDTEGFLTDYAKKHKLSLPNQPYAISCFTKKHINNLMWAHYADGNKGYCCEYDAKLLLKHFIEIGIFVFFLNYSDDRTTKVNLSLIQTKEERNKQNIKIYATKGKMWAYEEEIRVIKTPMEDFDSIPPAHKKMIIDRYKLYSEERLEKYKNDHNRAKNMFKDGQGPEIIPHQALTGIYFGCNCDEEDIKAIKNIVKNEPQYKKGKFFKMELDYPNGKYEMKANPRGVFAKKG